MRSQWCACIYGTMRPHALIACCSLGVLRLQSWRQLWALPWRRSEASKACPAQLPQACHRWLGLTAPLPQGLEFYSLRHVRRRQVPQPVGAVLPAGTGSCFRGRRCRQTAHVRLTLLLSVPTYLSRRPVLDGVTMPSVQQMEPDPDMLSQPGGIALRSCTVPVTDAATSRSVGIKPGPLATDGSETPWRACSKARDGVLLSAVCAVHACNILQSCSAHCACLHCLQQAQLTVHCPAHCRVVVKDELDSLLAN